MMTTPGGVSRPYNENSSYKQLKKGETITVKRRRRREEGIHVDAHQPDNLLEENNLPGKSLSNDPEWITNIFVPIP